MIISLRFDWFLRIYHWFISLFVHELDNKAQCFQFILEIVSLVIMKSILVLRGNPLVVLDILKVSFGCRQTDRVRFKHGIQVLPQLNFCLFTIHLFLFLFLFWIE